MASYTTKSMNLMAFIGAQLLSGIDQKNPNRAFICIPCDQNEIAPVQDRNGKTMANVSVALWPMRNRESYLNRVNQTRIAAGDAPKTLDDMPTHTMQLNHTDDFVLKNIKAFGQRIIDKALSLQSETYREQIKNDNAEDTSSKLFKVIRSLLNPSLGNFYQHQAQLSQPTYAQAQQVAQGVQGYTAPAEAPQDPYAYMNDPQYTDPEADLPF